MINEAQRLSNIGEYYFSKKMNELSKLIRSGKSIINLGIGNPDRDAPITAINSITRWVNNNGVHGYQPYRGIDDLRKAIALYYNQELNTELDYKTDILPIGGSKEGIMQITQSFVNEGETVAVPNPGYPTYISAARMVNASVVEYEVRNDRYRPIDLEFIDSLTNLKLLWLNFPHMPTGAIADKVLLKKLIDMANRKNFLIVYDNAYNMILNPEPISILSIPGAEKVCLELNSLSKTFNMAGWRMGWICGNSRLINIVMKYISNVDSGMFLPIQKAAVAAINTDKQWLTDQNIEYKLRRDIVCKMLSFLGCTFQCENTAGLFVWAKVPDKYADGEDLSNQLLEKASVFVTPGIAFGNNGKMYIRVSLCSEVWLLNQALMSIIDAFGKKKKKNLVSKIYSYEQQ